MVKDPFKKWDRVDTFCALLVNLGLYVCLQNQHVAILVSHQPVPFFTFVMSYIHFQFCVRTCCLAHSQLDPIRPFFFFFLVGGVVY